MEKKIYPEFIGEELTKTLEELKVSLPSITQVSDNYFIVDSGIDHKTGRKLVVGMNRQGLEELHKALKRKVKEKYENI
jgi:hypothetical protein